MSGPTPGAVRILRFILTAEEINLVAEAVRRTNTFPHGHVSNPSHFAAALASMLSALTEGKCLGERQTVTLTWSEYNRAVLAVGAEARSWEAFSLSGRDTELKTLLGKLLDPEH